MNRPALLDSSYLIDLERETAAGAVGPARRFLTTLRGRRIIVSIVSVEELLEGAADEAAALASLQRFAIQGLHLGQARRCALVQRRAFHSDEREVRVAGNSEHGWHLGCASGQFRGSLRI